MKFELTEQEAQIILNALVKEPFIAVVDVITKIQQQASEQLTAQQPRNPFYAEPQEGTGNGI